MNLKKIGIVGVKFGRDVTVVEPVNLYGCEIGDGCFIGPFVEIQKGVRIGARSKVQSHSFVCELVEIGADCVVAHGVMFINDPFAKGGPAHGDKTLWKPTSIGDRVSIGSSATILPVRICSDVVIGAGAVVTKDISTPGTYVGNPARLLRSSKRAALRSSSERSTGQPPVDRSSVPDALRSSSERSTGQQPVDRSSVPDALRSSSERSTGVPDALRSSSERSTGKRAALRSSSERSTGKRAALRSSSERSTGQRPVA